MARYKVQLNCQTDSSVSYYTSKISTVISRKTATLKIQIYLFTLRNSVFKRQKKTILLSFIFLLEKQLCT